jgi:lysozyme
MQLSDAGRSFIEANEGLRLDTYLDEASILTVGYGHVVHPSEPWWGGGHPSGHPVITQAQADALFEADLATYVACVAGYVKVSLTDEQVTALVDFAYNEGCHALAGSTVLRCLNAGDYAGAASHLLDWDKDVQNGHLVVSEGLLARRQREQALFLTASLAAVAANAIETAADEIPETVHDEPPDDVT